MVAEERKATMRRAIADLDDATVINRPQPESGQQQQTELGELPA